MNKNKAEDLLKKYRLGILTEEERSILESWYIQRNTDSTDFFLSEEELNKDLTNLSDRVLGKIQLKKKWYSENYFKITLIAASLLCVFFVVALYLNKNENLLGSNSIKPLSKINEEKIEPGEKKAILTLANNTKIILDDNLEGNVANQGGIKIQKTKEGKILYTIIGQTTPLNQDVQYNSISTPSGGEYEVQLSDGTKVWLNANSSLRFPTQFVGGKREVEVVGEVYFEVRRNSKAPFYVHSGKQTIEVLGTHFNVNTYDKEIKTTLFEGSVRVTLDGNITSKILRPGDQAIVQSNGSKFEIDQVDLEQVLAWKNGYFIFNNDDLSNAMKQIARWYDVEIHYETAVQHIKIGGAIARNRDLKDVLDLMALSANIKFKTQGRRIIVTK